MALIAVTVVTVLATPAKQSNLKEMEVMVGLSGGEAPQTICREHGVVCAVNSEHCDWLGGDGDFWLPF